MIRRHLASPSVGQADPKTAVFVWIAHEQAPSAMAAVESARPEDRDKDTMKTPAPEAGGFAFVRLRFSARAPHARARRPPRCLASRAPHPTAARGNQREPAPHHCSASACGHAVVERETQPRFTGRAPRFGARRRETRPVRSATPARSTAPVCRLLPRASTPRRGVRPRQQSNTLGLRFRHTAAL